MMMLPLGFCHFKDRCYIKTARNYVQHQKKGFEDDSSTLRSVCWICCFFLVIFRFFFVLFFTCSAASLLVLIGSVQVQ